MAGMQLSFTIGQLPSALEEGDKTCLVFALLSEHDQVVGRATLSAKGL